MERKYRHVIVVGIDGAGAFIREARTPCFDRIFAGGAVTYRALASRPTISAECWGSMLLGVGPEVHGLTNAIVSSAPSLSTHHILRQSCLSTEFPKEYVNLQNLTDRFHASVKRP